MTSIDRTNPVPGMSTTTSRFEPESVNYVEKLHTSIVEEAKTLSNAIGRG
jgi:hypothetical protein